MPASRNNTSNNSQASCCLRTKSDSFCVGSPTLWSEASKDCCSRSPSQAPALLALAGCLHCEAKWPHPLQLKHLTFALHKKKHTCKPLWNSGRAPSCCPLPSRCPSLPVASDRQSVSHPSSLGPCWHWSQCWHLCHCWRYPCQCLLEQPGQERPNCAINRQQTLPSLWRRLWMQLVKHGTSSPQHILADDSWHARL